MISVLSSNLQIFLASPIQKIKCLKNDKSHLNNGDDLF